MSTKKNKAKKLSMLKSKATPTLHWPWSELPSNLIQSPSTDQRYFHSIAGQGITKSWLTQSSRCKSTQEHRQWRRLHHLVNDDHPSKNPSATESYTRYFNNDDSRIDAGPNNTSYWCVLKANSTAAISPPPSMPPCLGAHHSPTRLEHYVVSVLFGDFPISTLRVFCEIHCERDCYHYKRIRYECVTIDPFDVKKKYMEFTSVVRCEGKVYALSLQGTLVVMQSVDLRLRITDMSARRAVPYASSRFFTEFLVELKGEIVLVFLIHQKSLEIVDQVEVFRLCLGKLEWIKVGRLQGKTLFLGESCFWANSDETGCRDDCVYFTQGSDNNWLMYDLKSGCILHV